ncbi:hypothetical protein AB4Z09_14040 [Rhodococcus sp. TAF43]|uniref:hypothetical protein n=1 Tax=unclassified Rhodococcus (in: high G+C Gram-positive bacteria) TaxID=192944 RepID=UPI001583084D|nr:hypothetical protein [Rhodococcus sp. W8901]QKT09450.1 hypothetical protein HUN07_00705 [Rhodococcus sp. W8901]
MSVTRPAPTAALRGGAVGAAAAALAIAAHGIAGGGFPDSAALTLLFASCAGVGVIVGGLPVLSRSRTALFAALAAGQGAGHLTLTLASDAHAHAGVPAAAMLTAHAAATVVCASLVHGAERLYGPITHVLRTVLAPLFRGVDPTSAPAPRPLDRRAPRLTVLAAGLTRRGPPVHA